MMLAGTSLDISGGNTEYISNDIAFGSGKKKLNPKMALYISELKKYRAANPSTPYREAQLIVAKKLKK